MIPEKFTTESEQFHFFNQLWNFGKYASNCRNKELYLNISKIIFDEIEKTDEFEILTKPLNKFYTIMAKYWNIDVKKEEEWQAYVNECDKYVDTLPVEQKKFMSDIFNELGKQLQKISSSRHRENTVQEYTDQTEVSMKFPDTAEKQTRRGRRL